MRPRTSDEKHTADALKAATSGAVRRQREALALIDDPAVHADGGRRNRAAREPLVRAREVAGGERADDRQLARQRERRGDLGERARLAGTRQPEDLQAGALARQLRAAADRADDQVRQRHRGIEPAIVAHLEARDARPPLRRRTPRPGRTR